MKVTIDEKKGEVTIVLPFEKKIEPTDSGKNLLLASTHGTVHSDVEHEGEIVKVGANVLVKNRAYVKPPKASKRKEEEE